MLLTHKIRLTPTLEQEDYFGRAAATSRKVRNWALKEWNIQYAAGKKPHAMNLEKEFNGVKNLEALTLNSHQLPVASSPGCVGKVTPVRKACNSLMNESKPVRD
jgi:transposase